MILTNKIKNSVIKDLLIYFISSILLRSITFLIMPALLRIMHPSEFGELSLITSGISIGVAVAGLGLRQVLAADFFGLTEQQQRITINKLIIIYLAIVVPFVILSVTTPLLCHLLPHCNHHALQIAAMHIFLFFFAELTYQWLQYQSKADLIMAIQLASGFIIALLTYIFVWQFDWRVTGVLAAQLSGIIFPSCVGIKLYIKNQFSREIVLPTKDELLSYLARGFPFIHTVLFAWILAAGNRFMLARLASLHDVGIYALADTACQLFYLLILYPWTAAYLPHMLKRYHQEEKIALVEQENQRIMWYTLLILLIGITAGTTLLNPLIRLIIPASYYAATSYVWILLLGQLGLLGGYFASCLLQFYKKGFFLACSFGLSAAVNISLNLIMIPRFGLYGCAWTTVISYLVYFGITLSYNRFLLSKQTSTAQ